MNEITSIRTALYNEVISTASFTASNTDAGRYTGQNIASSALPQAVVRFEETEQEYESIGSTRTKRLSSSWLIDVYTTTEALADGYIEEIINAMTDRTLGGITQDLAVSGMTYTPSTEADGDYVMASLRLLTHHTITKGD